MSLAAPINYPISNCHYRKLIEGNYFFVDKTLVLKELLHDDEVVVLTRPIPLMAQSVAFWRHLFAPIERLNFARRTTMACNSIIQWEQKTTYLKHAS